MSSPAEPWTVGRLLTWTTDFLKRHGSEQPRLEAELLLAHARSCPRIALYTTFHEEVDDLVRSAYREMVRERAAGKPVAYLVGHREFYSLDFRVTPDVLIPRPETEELVEIMLDLARRQPSSAPLDVADVGTGSGIIAVCAAKYLPTARVWAIDQSPAALAVARENAEQLGVAAAVQLIESDLFSAVPIDQQFDLIASNPPYVSAAEYTELSPDVRDYEPRQALLAGPTGTEVIERLLDEAVQRLRPQGWLLLEISPMIASRVCELFAARPEFSPVQLRKDAAQLQRVVFAQRRPL